MSERSDRMGAPDLRNNLLSARAVAEAFRRALEAQQPLSLVSLGTGEIIFLAYPTIPGFEVLPPSPSGIDPYRKYITDPAIRNEILEEVLHADIVGMPAPLYNGNWPEAQGFVEYYSIPTRRICDGYIGRHLHSDGGLYENLQGKRVYLIGNHVLNLQSIFAQYQIQLAGHTEVDFFADLPRVKDCVNKAQFDLAIISAGIPSLILAPWIARTLGRCALDFGCAVHYLS